MRSTFVVLPCQGKKLYAISRQCLHIRSQLGGIEHGRKVEKGLTGIASLNSVDELLREKVLNEDQLVDSFLSKTDASGGGIYGMKAKVVAWSLWSGTRPFRVY